MSIGSLALDMGEANASTGTGLKAGISLHSFNATDSQSHVLGETKDLGPDDSGRNASPDEDLSSQELRALLYSRHHFLFAQSNLSRQPALAFSSTDLTDDLRAQITASLFPILLRASSREQNALYSYLKSVSGPEDILESCLNNYKFTGIELSLEMGLSLLKRMGRAAWASILALCSQKQPELEYFVASILSWPEVSQTQRLEAARLITQHPEVQVRRTLLEQLEKLPPTAQLELLRMLQADPDESLRKDATLLSSELTDE